MRPLGTFTWNTRSGNSISFPTSYFLAFNTVSWVADIEAFSHPVPLEVNQLSPLSLSWCRMDNCYLKDCPIYKFFNWGVLAAVVVLHQGPLLIGWNLYRKQLPKLLKRDHPCWMFILNSWAFTSWQVSGTPYGRVPWHGILCKNLCLNKSHIWKMHLIAVVNWNIFMGGYIEFSMWHTVYCVDT